MYALALIATFAISFLLGSIPWGLVISKLFYKTDIREHGSGNIGTTNAMRTLGKSGGTGIFLLDFGKGLLSGLIAAFICTKFVMTDPSSFTLFSPGSAPNEAQSLLACSFCSCTLGHIFSPWLKFKGGKGIAVGAGALFVALGWIPGFAELSLFALLVLTTRYVSVGSIAAAFICPFIAVWVLWGNVFAILMCAVAGLVIIWAHRSNIKRLIKGTETRVGKKSGARPKR